MEFDHQSGHFPMITWRIGCATIALKETSDRGSGFLQNIFWRKMFIYRKLSKMWYMWHWKHLERTWEHSSDICLLNWVIHRRSVIIRSRFVAVRKRSFVVIPRHSVTIFSSFVDIRRRCVDIRRRSADIRSIFVAVRIDVLLLFVDSLLISVDTLLISVDTLLLSVDADTLLQSIDWWLFVNIEY